MTATASGPRKSRAALWVVIVGLALVLVIVATIAAAVGSDGGSGYFEGADDTEEFDDVDSSIGDAESDDLYVACDDGDMAACDELYYDSPVGSSDEEFGSTCGGRVNYELDGDCEEEF